MGTLYKITLAISIVGCLNWGMLGLFDIDLVAQLFGAGEVLTRIIYSLVGLAGIINIGLLLTPIEENKKL